MNKKTTLYIFLSFGTLTLLGISLHYGFIYHRKSLPKCELTYMRPNFLPISTHSKNRQYSLYYYQENYYQKQSQLNYRIQFTGIPVLFIHGHAGSFRQMRSLAAMCAEEKHLKNQVTQEFNFFTIDFQEELSSFSKSIIDQQADFVNDAIQAILSLYPPVNNKNPPQHVILFAHSMGGVVSYAALFRENYIKGSVKFMLFLASPNNEPPIYADRKIDNFYNSRNIMSHNTNLTIISIHGGVKDELVRSDLNYYPDISRNNPFVNSYFFYTHSMKNVWIPTDHYSILWCKHFIERLTLFLHQMIDKNTLQLIDSQQTLKEIILSNFETHFRSIINQSLSLNLSLYRQQKDDSNSVIFLPDQEIKKIPYNSFQLFSAFEKANLIDLLPSWEFSIEIKSNSNNDDEKILLITNLESEEMEFYLCYEENSNENLEENLEENLNENLDENSNENSNENLNENLDENLNENSNENSKENSNENSNEKSNEKLNENSNGNNLKCILDQNHLSFASIPYPFVTFPKNSIHTKFKSQNKHINLLNIYIPKSDPEIKSIIIHFKKNHKKLPEDFLFYEKIENLSNYTKITSSFLFPQNLSLENQIINKFHFSSLISSNMIYNLQFKFDSNSAFLPVIYGFTPPTQHETFSLVYEYLTKSNEEFLQYNFYLNSWNKFNQELIIVSDPQHPIEMKISINYLLTLGQWIKVFGLYLPLWSFSITVLSLWGPKGLFAKEYYIEEEEKTNEKDSKKSNEKKSNEKNILNQNPPSFMDILAFYFFRALILFPIIIIITFIIDKIIAPNLLENQASFPWPISVFLAMICGFALVTMFATFSYIFIFISTFIVKIFKPIFAKNSNQNPNQNSNPNSNQNQNQNQNQNSKFLSFAFLSIFILDFALIFFLHPIFDYFFNLFLRFLFTIFIKTKTQTSNAQTKYNLKLLFNKQIGLCSSSLFLSLMFVPSLMMWKQYLEYYGFFYSQYKIRPIILLSIPIILLLKKDIWEAISLGSLQKYISFQQSKMETQKILIKIAISLYLISLVIVLLFFMDKIYYIQDFFCLISIIELISMAIPVKKLKEKQD